MISRVEARTRIRNYLEDNPDGDWLRTITSELGGSSWQVVNDELKAMSKRGAVALVKRGRSYWVKPRVVRSPRGENTSPTPPATAGAAEPSAPTYRVNPALENWEGTAEEAAPIVKKNPAYYIDWGEGVVKRHPEGWDLDGALVALRAELEGKDRIPFKLPKELSRRFGVPEQWLRDWVKYYGFRAREKHYGTWKWYVKAEKPECVALKKGVKQALKNGYTPDEIIAIVKGECDD